MTIAEQIGRSAYFFVPLAMSRNRLPDPAPNADEETLVARTFSSELSAGRLATLYAASDAVVVPSRYEPSGLVAREAQACGAAVVATPVGGLAEAVVPGRTGLQIGVGDVHALQGALAELVTDPARARRLADAGRAAVAGYTWSDATALTTAVYAAALPP